MMPAGIELRVAWLLLGIAVPFAYADPSGRTWTAWLAVPWLGGAAVLLRRRWLTTSAERLGEAVQQPAVRVALVLLGFWLVGLALVFTISATFIPVIIGGAGMLVLAAFGGAGSVQRTLLGGATSIVVLTVLSGVMEFVLRMPSLAVSMGAPTELAKWPARYDRVWEHNIFGFRSPYESISPHPDLRILVLGDSFTWGDKIAETDSTWPARLEQSWRARRLGQTIEVINTAQRGFTTQNQAELMRRIGWQFDPSLVVVQFLANDGLPSAPNFAHVGEMYVCPIRTVIPARFRTRAALSSAFIALVERGVTGLLSGQPCHTRMKRLYHPESPTWAQFTSALKEMGDSARARDTPIVLMLFPFLLPGEWSAASYPLRDLHATVARAAEEAGFHVLDLTPAFVAAGGDWRKWWAEPYDPHPNATAHALVAETLLEFIEGETSNWSAGLLGAAR